MEPATAFNILSLILVAASMAGTWMVFVKAGYQGWKGIIPIYNYYILLRITRHSGWWLTAFVAPALLIFLAGTTVQYQLIELTAESAQTLVEAISLLVLIAAPIVITVNAVVMYDIARAFGKRLPFTVGLTLFPFIFLVWLGFGDETFYGVPEDQHKAAGVGGSDNSSDDPSDESNENEQGSNDADHVEVEESESAEGDEKESGWDDVDTEYEDEEDNQEGHDDSSEDDVDKEDESEEGDDADDAEEKKEE